MTDPDQKQKLAELEARIAAAKDAQAPEPRRDEHYSQAQLAWRMVIELVAGLGIGFGTRPAAHGSPLPDTTVTRTALGSS